MNESDIELLSGQLRAERARNRLSQEQMAKALGISRPTYNDLESHPNKISLEQGLIINYYLNWNMFDFILSSTLHNAISKGE